MPYVASHSRMMKKCIEQCQRCHSICLETFQYCLEKGGKHVRPEHLQSLRDCAEICQTSANFMLTSSPLHPMTCNVCANACERCEISCVAVSDDEQMKACADQCRSCADSCITMSGDAFAAA